jgi:hypothetical protein
MKLKYSMDVIERTECMSKICILKKYEIIKFESLLSYIFVQISHSEWDKAICLTVRLLLAIWANCWHYSVYQTIVI